ncbi:hypothetical protein GCM10009682_11480 [Luedemannella flava]|uniref:SCO6045-like C-terminal domain-containing protein n=1 Tax=Luedemannella flava TaxID=349316 RepID=A0ABP4XU51_9ACTN
MSREDLARAQAALVAALVAGAAPPPGFDPTGVRAAAAALLRKRAGEVAGAWPVLAASFGSRWTVTFGRWAATRPTRGSLRDGWDLARQLRAGGALSLAGLEELAVREVRWRYRPGGEARRRRLPAVRRLRGVTVVQVLGRVRVRRARPARGRS